MKKIVYIAAVAAFGILIGGGCAKESGNLLPENGGFSISVSTPGTKTVFDGDTYKVDWEDNDELGIVIDDGTQSKLYKFTRSAGNTFSCADFVPSDGKSYTYYALYPYNEKFTITDGISNDVVEISSGTQSGLDKAGHIKTPLYGKASAEGTESPSISLNHAAAVMKINVANYSGSELSVSSVGLVSADADAVMSGTFSLNFETGELTASETSNTASQVNIDAKIDDASSAYFYVAVAPFATKNLSVTVNDQVFSKTATENGFDFKAGYVYATSVVWDQVTLTQTVEDANVYAALQELKAGVMNFTASIDGTTYYLCPEDGTFKDGEAIAVTLSETADNCWTFPAADTYRIVYNATANTVTVYSSENEFNQPKTVQFNYQNNNNEEINWVFEKTLTAGTYYVRNGNSWWNGRPYDFVESLADPQILIWDGKGSTINVPGSFCIKLGQSMSDFVTIKEGTSTGGNNPVEDNMTDFVSRIMACQPKGSSADTPLEKNVWMDMNLSVYNFGWTSDSYPVKVSKILIDFRNMKIRIDVAE